MRILFVCTGNICRSPAAEGILKKLVSEAGLSTKVMIESAATSSYTEGEPRDGRMVEHARERGYHLEGEARPFRNSDFETFDLIFTMDEGHLRHLRAQAQTETQKEKVVPVTSYCLIHHALEVPDPYYGTEVQFRYVLDLLEDACEQIFRQKIQGETFTALRVHNREAQIESRLETLKLADLNQGEVTIRCAFSSLNYKDALAVTGRGKILRKHPLVAGIDAAGWVHSSTVPDFKAGDEVLVTGCNLSETQDGGYSSYLRVPASSVIPRPNGLSLEESMILGTAGFTAALCLYRLLENHQTPQAGPVLVTGASGGVGSIAINLLAKIGFKAWAVSGRPELKGWLSEVGAERVITSEELELGVKPLDTVRFGGAIDNVGGDLLAGIARHTNLWGNIACVGLASGHELSLSVMPLILRGVSLLGISSNNCPRWLREELWRRLASDWRPQLNLIHTRTISLQEVAQTAELLLKRSLHGRVLVRLD